MDDNTIKSSSGGDETSASPSSPSDAIISDLITVTVKTIDSKNFQFQVENDMKIRAFKEKIAPTVDIEWENQRMIFCGRVLADDKTLKDYKIDSNKVIHLVKRAPLPKNDSNNANSGGQTTNQQQQNDRGNRSRFQSYRADDGSSVLMGSFQMDTASNFMNQLMRQLFNHRPGSGASSDSNTSDSGVASTNNDQSSILRARFNHIRQLLTYVETSLQILNDPTHIPTGHRSNAFADDHTITLTDYVGCFNDVLSYMDRLRPYLETWIGSINPNNSDNNNNRQHHENFSIIMRIVHHLSHVFHALTDLSINPNDANSPININVLNNPIRQQTSNADNNQSTTNDNTSASNRDAVAQNENNPSATETQSSTNNQSQSNADSNATNEFVSPPIPQDDSRLPSSAASNNNNSMFRSLGSIPGGVLVAQSPIVLMEVDATINGQSLGPRAIRNLSLSDFSSTLNELIGSSHLNNVTFNTLNSGPNNEDSNGSQANNNNNDNTVNFQSSQFSNPPVDSENQPTNESNSANNTSSNSNNAGRSNQNSSSSNPAMINPFQLFSARFDPYLNCNSTYTMPEIRSTTNIGPMITNMMMDSSNHLTSAIGSVSFGSSSNNNSNSNTNDLRNLDLMRNNLVNLQNMRENENHNGSSSDSTTDDGYFFNFINYLLGRINQLQPRTDIQMDEQNLLPRIQDYIRHLNLINSNDESLFSNMLSSLFQNLDFLDLYQMINANFSQFALLRPTLQSVIRDNLLTSDNDETVRSEIENMIQNNRTLLADIVSGITPATGVDHVESFIKFIQETLTKFFEKILQSNNDETFGEDLTNAVKYLVNSYIQFCEACFADPTNARTALIRRSLQAYDSVDSQLMNFLIQIICQRVNQTASNNYVRDEQLEAEIQSYIVRRQQPQQQQQQEEKSSIINNDAPASMDSMEYMEFSDAYSEMPPPPPPPSTSSLTSTSQPSFNTYTISNIDSDQSSNGDWQSIVPNDWVPIIKEDIQKQKSIDPDHQPPFSDAYISGMSKKRRLEHDQQQQQQQKQNEKSNKQMK